jgi:hypothetical protein
MSVSLLLLFVTLLKLAFIFGIGMAVAGNSNDISVVWDGVGHIGTLSFQGRDFTCSVGKNGVTKEKVEGDGCSPKGSFPLRRAFYRSDRVHLNETIPTYLQLEVTQSNMDGLMMSIARNTISSRSYLHQSRMKSFT